MRLLAGMNRQLQAGGLACVRNDRVLFHDLSFRLGGGEVLQVRGINGSGKSSLLRIVCGLLAPERGAVHWGGEDIATARASYLAELAYLGHLHGMKDDLSVGENIAFSLALGRCRRSAVEIDAALERLRLGAYRNTLVGRLSAGQRRRLALVRFVVSNAALWIMDEPFAALDAAGKQLVCVLISEHASRGGLCIVATHEPLQLTGAKLTDLNL